MNASCLPRHFIAILLGAVLLMFLLAAQPLMAQHASLETAFTASVVVQNISRGSASFDLLYRPQARVPVPAGTPTATPVPAWNTTLASRASGSYFLGILNHRTNDYRGSGTVFSTRDLATTVVFIPQNSVSVAAEAIVNGTRTDSNVGTNLYLATVVSRAFTYDISSLIAVQNVSNATRNITIYLYSANRTSPSNHTFTYNNVPAGTSIYLDMAAEFPDGYDGSANITSNYTNAVSTIASQPSTLRQIFR